VYIYIYFAQSAWIWHIESVTLLKPLQHDSVLPPFEQLHIQSFHQAGKLIPEQYPNDPNPLFQLAFSHPPPTRHRAEPVKQHPATRTQPTALNQTGNLKTKGMYILLLAHIPNYRLHIHTITAHPTNGIPDPQTRTNHPATNPPMIPTHYPHDTRHTLKQTYITHDT